MQSLQQMTLVTEINSQVNQPELNSEQLEKWQTLEIEVSGDLAQTLDSVNSKLGTHMIPRLDGFHLTVISPPESGKLKSLTPEQIENLKKINSDIQQGIGIAVDGIGYIDGSTSTDVLPKDRDKKTCFISIKSPTLESFRTEIGLAHRDLHITLGFEKGDIHLKTDKTPITKRAEPSLADIAPNDLHFGPIRGQNKS